MRKLFIIALFSTLFVVLVANAAVDISSYTKLVDEKIKQNWEPGDYRKDIVTPVEIDINPGGFINEIRILEESEYKLFNQYIELVIQKAEPLEPPGEDVTVKIIFQAKQKTFPKESFKDKAIWFFSNLILI